jgi:hypothetical protein
MKKTAIAPMRAAIKMTQPSQKLGSWPASGITPKNARLTIAAVARIGSPSAGQMVSQPNQANTAAAAPRARSTGCVRLS